MKRASAFDRSAAARVLLTAAPTRMYLHEAESWVEVDRQGEWDSARLSVDEYVRRANRGREFYMPPNPNSAGTAPSAAAADGATTPSSGSAHPPAEVQLKDLVRESYRTRPSTSASMNEAFSAVKLFTTAAERLEHVPKAAPFQPRAIDPGFRLTDVGSDGEFAPFDGTEMARVLVAHPLLPSIFRHTIVCLLPQMVEPKGQDTGSATGFIVNRPLVNDHGVIVPVWAAFPAGIHSIFTDLLAKNAVMVGGPVGAITNRTTALFVVHRLAGVEDAVVIAPGVWATFGNYDALEAKMKADNVSPQSVMVVAGYAGWGNQQLGGEIKMGSWFVAECADAGASADFLMSCNVVADPETQTTTNHPSESWCQLLQSWGPAHADLTRLAKRVEPAKDEQGEDEEDDE
jgi:putative transcriptional regulator